ncbi:sortase [Corynebacterium macginleyi]
MVTLAIDVHAQFAAGACRVVDGAIDPDTMDKACTYTAEDCHYSLPETNADDIVIIAEQTGGGVPAVFNNLYDGSTNEHKIAIGDKVYVRTRNSVQNWLIYTATDLHDPSKQGLAGDSSIWGHGELPAPQTTKLNHSATLRSLARLPLIRPYASALHSPRFRNRR